MITLENVKRRLATLHPGGYHYVDYMRFGTASRVYYAVATIDSYYTSAETIDDLYKRVSANIKRGERGNSFK